MSDNKELLTIAVIAHMSNDGIEYLIPSNVLTSSSIEATRNQATIMETMTQVIAMMVVAVMTTMRMTTVLMIAATAMVIVVAKMMKKVMMVVVIMIVPTQALTAVASLKIILENIQHAFQIYPQTIVF